MKRRTKECQHRKVEENRGEVLMSEELEIYFDDLTEETKKKVLKFLCLKSAEEGNLDILPLTTIPKPEE